MDSRKRSVPTAKNNRSDAPVPPTPAERRPPDTDDDAGELRHIRLLPDYGTRWPVWDAEDDDTINTLTLSAALRADLLHWVEEWETHFDYLEGWSSRVQRDAWFAVGDDLTRRLEDELRPTAKVEPRFRAAYGLVAGKRPSEL